MRLRETLDRLGVVLHKPSAAFLMSLCAALAVTTRLKNGVTMGLCITLILALSSLTLSLLSRFVPDKLREVTALLLFAFWTTAVSAALSAFLPTQAEQLGVFLPLTAVSGSLIAWSERTASRQPPQLAGLESALTGLRLTLSLAAISLLREFFGSGTVWGMEVFSASGPARLLEQPAGGFLLFGFLIAAVQALAGRRRKE